MAKRRYRDYLRVNMTAKTGTFIRESLVDKTFNDHFTKNKCVLDPGCLTMCSHEESGTLLVARTVEAGIKVGKKRATLDLACPYSLPEPHKQVWLLKHIAQRIEAFSKDEKRQLRSACVRIVEEIRKYADRNAMQVIAEAAL